ncbi:hypothetical protein HNP46_002197 [Pseudomonas nitritireducens]|uniref:DUF2635 domain-containing protein n=1 Tax=Pseudomonas nitroreducens TaxID=46680 RepID=A0A7W7KIB8_PSENT|nr:DUF2635 domain-containing protein [Pseudomonas nitritireducens]MBB4863350.1 hypothetical protein [Pseudomonas nitritireducens]
MRVYPSPGLLVRDPVKKDFLPEEGRDVPDDDHYWLRRLSCGDATKTPPKKSKAAQTELDGSAAS